jgi:hypothetical protein
MFMFTFSVLAISIVGLFFQIVSAVTAYFLSLQLSLGEQMLKWHSIAFAYSCTTAGLALPAGSMITKADVDRTSELAGLYNWHTEIFDGTYNGKPNVRMIVTYVTPTEKPSGFSAADVARQLLRVTSKQHYRFGRANGGAVGFTTYDDNPRNPTIQITGLPTTPSPGVVDNSVVLVSDSTCN